MMHLLNYKLLKISLGKNKIIVIAYNCLIIYKYKNSWILQNLQQIFVTSQMHILLII